MQKFEDQSQQCLTPTELGERAMDTANKLFKTHRQNNTNKLKKMSTQISTSRDKWESLAVLARFYPLTGVPGPVIDHLVSQLEQLHLGSFKELVARALLFYEAKTKGWEG